MKPYLRGDAAGTFVYSIGLHRLDLAVAEASKALGVRLSLRTAPPTPTPLPTQRCGRDTYPLARRGRAMLMTALRDRRRRTPAIVSSGR